MVREHTGTNRERSEYYGALQDIVNALFAPYGDLDPTVAEAIGAKVRWWPPRQPTFPRNCCASSRCCRPVTTRASACAPS